MGEMLGIFAIRVFPLGAESYYKTITETNSGNKVACGNKRALHTFTKRIKSVPTGSSNVNVLGHQETAN